MKVKYQVYSLVNFAIALVILAFTGLVLADGNDPYARYYQGSPTQKAWGVDRVDSPPTGDHFKVGDLFVLRGGGENVIFLPGKIMRDRGWKPIVLKKMGGPDNPILCMEDVELSHGHGPDNKAPHVFTIGPDDNGGNGINIWFGDMDAGDTCEESRFHGGTAHSENN